MRCFYNLIGPHEIIRDEQGVEVRDVAEAVTEARKAIEELIGEEPETADNMDGWSLEIVDGDGSVLAVHRLSASLADIDRLRIGLVSTGT